MMATPINSLLELPQTISSAIERVGCLFGGQYCHGRLSLIKWLIPMDIIDNSDIVKIV